MDETMSTSSCKDHSLCNCILFLAATLNTHAQYTKLLDLNGLNGFIPYGGVTLSGSVLYGMTAYGGTHNDGNIFKINTDGTGYMDLFDFNGGHNITRPYGTLFLSGSYLYGMTRGGGLYQDGQIFKVKTNGTDYQVLLDFNNTNGSSPFGSLTLLGSNLFGMTRDGGLDNYGVIFKIDTNGNNYQVLLDFNNSNGRQPYGSLTLSADSFLWDVYRWRSKRSWYNFQDQNRWYCISGFT